MSDVPSVSSPLAAGLPQDCEAQTLGVAFFDLSRMAEWASSEADARVASFLQTFYKLAADHLRPDCDTAHAYSPANDGG